MRQPRRLTGVALCLLSGSAVPLPRSLPASGAAPAPRVARAAEPLTPAQTEALVLLGRVWGFVKYHHPRVAGGAVAWDAELRRVIPAVLAARTEGAARDTIDAWLAAVGEPPACDPCAIAPAEPHLLAEVDWIRDAAHLGPVLSARLGRIHANRSVAEAQHHVQRAPGVGNAVFTNEDAYPADSLPPADLRLLGVFRFWNMLEYWFPYRNLMEPDRVALLREFVPAAWAASDVPAYHRAMMRLVARARDGHANLWSSLHYRPPGGAFALPVVVRSVEGQFVVAGVAPASLGPATGLRPGDVLRRIGGAPVDSLARAWAPYFGASNEAARRRDLARALTRGEDEAVPVEVDRGGRRLTVTVRRRPMAERGGAGYTHDRPGDTFQMLAAGADSVAYLKLSMVVAADAAAYMRRAAAAKVFVIDIRNYPADFVVFALGAHLAPGRPFARFTAGSTSNPGAFTWTPPVTLRAAAPLTLLAAGPTYTGRVVILVDETSQSQAEYTAMAFRSAPGALVVGSTTAGADGNVSPIPLPGGLRALISGIGVFYPDKRPTQQVGIVPDVEVRPTIAGIRAGRDEVLEAAISRALGRAVRLTP